MKKRSQRKNLIKAGLLCACVLCAGSITTVSAAEDVANEMQEKIEHIYKGEDIFKTEPLVIETEPDLKIGEGKLTEGHTSEQLKFTVPRNGNYCMKLDDISAGCDIWCGIYDDFNNEVLTFTTGNGGRQIVNLQEGISYTMNVEQSNGDTGFTCTLQQQPPTVDISEVSHVQDQVLFTEQKNRYTFTPEVNGVYSFTLTDKTAKASFDRFIWDEYDVLISEFQDGSSVYLEAGMEYELQVRQSEGFGRYTLNVNRQKKKEDITGYTQLDDTIQFRGQENDYTFIPPVTGIYHMGKKNIRSEYNVQFLVFDRAADSWILDSTAGNYQDIVNNGLELEAGKEYTLKVCEDGSGLGEYSIYIEYPAEALDFLKEFKPKEEKETSETEEDTRSLEEIKEENIQLKEKNQELEEENEQLRERNAAFSEMLVENGIISE